MSKRIQIDDKKGEFLTFVYWAPPLNGAGEGNWLPDTPGYVVARRDKRFNVIAMRVSKSTDTMNMYFYAEFPEGKLIRVLKLSAICDSYAGFGSPIWNDGGLGWLYKEGEAVMVEGDLKWTLF